LPKARKDLIALAKENRPMLDAFVGPEGTWATELEKWMSSERFVELGYRVTRDFVALASAIASRYGVKCLGEAFRPWPRPKLSGTRGPAPVQLRGERRRLRSLIQNLLMVVLAFEVREGIKEIEVIPPSLSAKVEQMVLLMMSETVRGAKPDDPPANVEVRRRLLLFGLNRLAKAYETLGEQEPRMLSGPFSHLRIREFPELAKRTQAMKKKYGERHIETIFEDQLALLAQSLGFYVVRARRGTRRVDLLCLTTGGAELYTALIEAKTSGRPYAFPTDDQRALREYVEDVRATLATLPTLRFLLLVGYRAASTLEAKLRDFETEVGVPVRFVDAEALVTLRDRLPGPVPLGAFRDMLVRSESRVLDLSFVDAVAAAFEKGHEAHVKFVQELMSSRH
jgi:hypothetical protein